MLVVPVTTEQAPPPPPPPGKLERQPSVKTKANKKGTVKIEEVLNESANEDEYEKAVEDPVSPIAQPPAQALARREPLTRVDKMRMLARSGLPK